MTTLTDMPEERRVNRHVGTEAKWTGHPTETCFMLSEVTTAQDESREDEEKNDTEQPSTESPVKDPNGDITQENSPEPDVKSPESSDTGV